MRFQIIQIDNKYDNNEIYINLYQKNEIFSYIMLIQKIEEKEGEKPNYIYIDSITSLNDKLNDKKEYERHFGLSNTKLEKGIYYICCDVNYRFLNNGENIDDYLLNIYSLKNQLLKVENVTEKMELNEKLKIFRKSIYYFIDKIEYDKKEKLYLLNDDEKFTFDIYYFKNQRDKKIKIEFTINEEVKKQYFFYNDNEAKESDKKVIKAIEPKESIILCVMKYEFNLKGEKYLNSKIIN